MISDKNKHESLDHAKRRTLKRALLQLPIIVTFKVSELQAQASQTVTTWSGGSPNAPK